MSGVGSGAQGRPGDQTPGLFDVPEPPAAPALGAVKAAAVLPVARVLLETPVPHLDRPFDYLVSAELDDAARPGVRVRVPFGGRRLNGYLLERVDEPEPGVRPVPLAAVVSPEVVLDPDVLALARDVAERYAGTVADVLRAALPPRVAKVEKEEREAQEPFDPGLPEPGPWSLEDGGAAFLDALAAGESPRVVTSCPPDGGAGWATRLALAAQATLASGRGALLLVPDARDLERLCEVLDELLGAHNYARLSADDGPTPRYRAFLRAARGDVALVVGTRNAAFAPVRNLGLVSMWDDHDSSYLEPRAPYHHAREVLLLRAAQAGCAALFASAARSAEAQRLVLTGWAQELSVPRSTLRDVAPWVRAAADDFAAQRDPLLHAARVPRIAWEAAKRALESAPVLVQVARTGFLPALRCERCREAARCPKCGGPLALARSGGDPVCRWCGTYCRDFTCPHCHGKRLRAGTVGADRTAEELGRAFPGVAIVRATGADGVRSVGPTPALVISTPGAEPVAEGGYGAVLILDADAQLAPEGLRVGEDALHRWFAAASLAKGREAGGVVVLTGHASPQGRALVRWDPAGAAQRELGERSQAALPPAVRSAVLVGPAAAADRFASDIAAAAEGLRLVGPTPGEEPEEHRWILFFDHAHGPRVTSLLRRRKGLGSLRKDPVVHVRVDDPRAL
ncbi:primosomal protein N' family DNA-binding protein [Galactobacter valiniphilus]|uniref:primosomal protein N' family DNA-binding protein n=1 Tax=Galactobacter valiniphilus TaxID=2676122 RepID=UPI003736A792